MELQEQKRVFGRIYASDGAEIDTFNGRDIPSLKKYEEHFPLTIHIVEETIIDTIHVER